ncbi:hypothetical protein LTR97_010432 [Elasticomyces elasticus]|uniref:Glycosyltransferase 2 n=1 Tax=Elasticomyces elasticus TaxID=574655 RepID=A0AAN7ZZ38_9PEZI|nr:hypothetical protein LTR97_010432 [Elasticomyces elasticus]
MLGHARVYSKDEELGKRDDDFKPKRSPTLSGLLQPWRWRRRRIFVVIALLALAYVLLPQMRYWPQDLGVAGMGTQWSSDSSNSAERSAGNHIEPTGPPPRPSTGEDHEDGKHYYDGPIKFYRLATSLHAIARTMGTRPQNRNVLFAVSSLRSAANLMPMVCEMAKWDRNYVHVAFLGRESLSIEQILEINGVSREDCTAFFHDARADYSEFSSDKRAEVAVSGAMKHINDFMHPQAMIMDDSALEDAFLVRAMRNKGAEMGRALIEVPAGRYDEFLWMTRLDSGSLSNWFKPTIDILVHALPDSSGGLIRLVKSLETADYTGLARPKLTIELPSDIEHFAKVFLERLQWPPHSQSDPWKQSDLLLRHRIVTSHANSEQAAVRFLESYFPANHEDNHVLVLSPQAEISPTYLQYLHYVLLEYKYSSYASAEADNMLGVSLDVPTTALSGVGSFVQPSTRNMSEQTSLEHQDRGESIQEGPAPFLYQAPSATASLIFGDKWATFHNFVSNRLTASHLAGAAKASKLVSETEPAWLEYLLELMRARGWSMLHPAFSFVTVHNELAQVPEEYTRERDDQKPADVTSKAAKVEDEPFLLAAEAPIMTEHAERETPQSQPLQDMLPFSGGLPELPHLPYLAHTGELVDGSMQEYAAIKYASLFRRRVGGCIDKDATRPRVLSDIRRTDDLFCLPGVDIEFDDSTEDEEAQIAAHEVIAETGGTVGEDAPDFAAEAIVSGLTNGDKAATGQQTQKADDG